MLVLEGDSDAEPALNVLIHVCDRIYVNAPASVDRRRQFVVQAVSPRDLSRIDENGLSAEIFQPNLRTVLADCEFMIFVMV